jgi:hypothetical protein
MAIDRRNQLLREAAGKFWPDLPVSMQAAALAAELSGYASATWIRRDRLKPENPYSDESLRGYLWRALKAHPFPPSERTLRDIIASSDPPTE